MDNLEHTDIKEDINNRIRRRSAGRILVPLGLVCVGSVLLAHQFGMPMPEWMFSWQFLLIVIGIFSGLAHAFRGPGWLIMILVGTFFLMDQLDSRTGYSSFYLAGCHHRGRSYHADPSEKTALDGARMASEMGAKGLEIEAKRLGKMAEKKTAAGISGNGCFSGRSGRYTVRRNYRFRKRHGIQFQKFFIGRFYRCDHHPGRHS